MKRIPTYIFLLFISLSHTFGQNYLDSLDQALSLLQQKGALPGFAVSIVNADGVLYQKGFGYAHVDEKIPFSEHTLMNIGSISKTFIGIAIMKAVESGTVKLDDPINDYLPFKVVNPHYPEIPITLRHLANHTSSIDDTKYYSQSYIMVEDPKQLRPGVSEDYAKFMNKREVMSLTEYLERILSKGGTWYRKKNFLKHAPGTQYTYSNTGAALAAFVLEHATGVPFDQYTQEHILDPLGMEESGWSFDHIDLDQHAFLYFPDRAGVPRYRLITYPDGGMLSNAHDMGLYLSHAIKGYKGEEGPLSPGSYQTLMKPRLDWEKFPKGENNIGIFWDIQKKGNIGHNGGDPGIFSNMFFNPQTGIGKFMFTNIDATKETVSQFREIWQLMGKYEDKL